LSHSRVNLCLLVKNNALLDTLTTATQPVQKLLTIRATRQQGYKYVYKSH